MLGAAAFSFAYLYITQAGNKRVTDLEQACSLPQLLKILEDMRIQYTPYYIHYYHMMTALEQEYRDKP